MSLCFGQSAKQASATNFSESRAGAAVSIRLLRQKKKKEEAEGNATHRPNLTTIFSCTRHIKSARDVLFGQFCLRFRLLASTRHFQSENGDASASPTCLVPLCSPQKYTDPIAPRCVTQSPPSRAPKDSNKQIKSTYFGGCPRNNHSNQAVARTDPAGSCHY